MTFQIKWFSNSQFVFQLLTFSFRILCLLVMQHMVVGENLCTGSNNRIDLEVNLCAHIQLYDSSNDAIL